MPNPERFMHWIRRAPKTGGPLVSLEASNRPTGLVDTDSFLFYLRGKFNPSVQEASFAENLDLSVFTSFMQEVYETERDGFVYDKQMRKEWKDLENKIRRDNLGGTADFLLDHTKQMGGSKAIAERARVIYWGIKGGVQGTKISSGDHTSVSQFWTFLRTALHLGIPLMDIHTHPDDALPSTADYYELVCSPYEGKRTVRASMVLCPNIQILTVATPTTPALPYKEYVELKDAYREGIYGSYEGRVHTLERRVGKIRQIPLDRVNRSVNQLVQLNQGHQEGKYSDEERDELSQQILDKLNSEVVTERVRNVLIRTERQYSDEMSHAINTTLLQMPRDLNILTYTSTDMRNFVRSSA